MAEAAHESEVSHVIAGPQTPPPTHWPSLAAALQQLVWWLPLEKQVPEQHRRASALRGWAQPVVSPQGGWVGHDSVGPGVEGEEWVREQVILGLWLGWLVVSMCEGGIACAGSHDPQLTHRAHPAA